MRIDRFEWQIYVEIVFHVFMHTYMSEYLKICMETLKTKSA